MKIGKASLLGLMITLAAASLSVNAHALMRGEISKDHHGTRRSTVLLETPEGVCTGALIGPRLVLTAAHCLSKSGRYVLKFSDSSFRKKSVKVKRVALHMGFDPDNGFSPDDVGLIELAVPLPHFMVPALMPTIGGTAAEGEPLLIAGFGSTEQPKAKDGVLREAVLLASQPSVPGRSFSGLENGDGKAASGMCVGDSGGPVYRKRGSELILVGILKGGTTDDGQDCTSRPVYTPISHYMSWVRMQAIEWGLSLGPATQEMKK